MFVCPWCGTNYLTFQPNCQNCGGQLQLENTTSSGSSENLAAPPAAPRPISDSYVWRLLFADTWAIVALIFCLLGFIFSIVGTVLTLGIITAFVGIPFLLIGIGLLGTGVVLLAWRYQGAQKVVRVLKEGESSLGHITEVQENYSVRINGRYPWMIGYEYQVNGQTFAGKVATLNRPEQMQVGHAVRVLYLSAEPKWSSIYPHP